MFRYVKMYVDIVKLAFSWLLAEPEPVGALAAFKIGAKFQLGWKLQLNQ